MNWYREYRNEWKEIIETVARECKRAELMVEKDTVLSLGLKTVINAKYALFPAYCIISLQQPIHSQLSTFQYSYH